MNVLRVPKAVRDLVLHLGSLFVAKAFISFYLTFFSLQWQRFFRVAYPSVRVEIEEVEIQRLRGIPSGLLLLLGDCQSYPLGEMCAAVHGSRDLTGRWCG